MSRKLDVAVAEALGYEVKKETHLVYGYVGSRWVYEKNDRLWELPLCSSDGNAMLELCKEMQRRGFAFHVGCHSSIRFTCEFFKMEWVDVTNSRMSSASTMPKAVALAAYHALTGEKWEGAETE